MSEAFHRFTLDQLTVWVAVVETGSFSGAGRRLGRVQSAVSHAIAQLEAALEVELFDRTGRRAELTPAGRRLLPEAQLVLDRARAFAEDAASIRAGVESQLVVAVDALYPRSRLVEASRAFAEAFPTAALRIAVDTLGDAVRRVREGEADVGLCLLDPDAEPELERVGAGQVDLWPVCAPHHPLAELPPPQPRRAFGPWVQVVLSERRGSDPTDRGVLSARTWRVSDIDTKAALIAGGVGWGSLPEDRAAAGIDRGTLSRLHPEPFHGGRETLRFSAIRRSGRAVGPGARWWLDRWAEEAR